MSNWFSGIVPVVRENATIAENILAHVAAMRQDGSYETTSLCWSPAQLELLAMYAIEAKYKLQRLDDLAPLFDFLVENGALTAPERKAISALRPAVSAFPVRG